MIEFYERMYAETGDDNYLKMLAMIAPKQEPEHKDLFQYLKEPTPQ